MLKIVIIDDDIDILDQMGYALELAGFVTHKASNGRDGIQLIKSYEPDLVVSDINMPDMDGYTILRELKKQPQTADIPFIFVTAQSDRSSFREGMELGADDFLPKPFSGNELIRAVSTQIAKHRLVEERHETTMRMLKNNISYALPHELRTPLMTVMGYAQIILSDYQTIDRNELKEWTQKIVSGSQRLERVIENYLVYAQLQLLNDPEEIAQLRNNIVPDIKPIIISAIEEVANAHQRMDDLFFEVESLAVRMSSSDLRKIVFEIADNAFKFSKENNPVEVMARRIGNKFVLKISDQGRGIPPEDIELMGGYIQFDRTLHEQQGLGLGFAIARKLISVHEGGLTIDSKPKEGTQITIEFNLY